MSRIREFNYYVGDFETTVYRGQTDTEVWASAIVPFNSEDVKIFHSISETFQYIKTLGNCIIYYHNLKFDGSFWIDYLIREEGYQQAYLNIDQFMEHALKNEECESPEALREKLMPNKSFNYIISEMGQWYAIKIKINHHIIELRDSLKLLPFSVKQIGESFGTKHRKLEMEYTGLRYAGCNITPEEKKYIANDVLVVKEALEIMYAEGHKELTIGSCCLKEYKRIIGKEQYESWFPNLYNMELDESYGSPTAGDYIRKSYKGGWCYLVKGKENKIYHNGVTADVNSLYPSMMHSESGNIYPVGYPTFWKGNTIPFEAMDNTTFFFIRIKTRFYIKENKLPFIQIKNTFRYKGTESLESSDIAGVDGKLYTHWQDHDGNIHDTRVELTLTQTDFFLINEHYDLVDFEILDGCYFRAEIGIFDEYIDKYKEMKINNKGARRQLAKLFLNNLYGKMASSMDSTFKLAYMKEDGIIGFLRVLANDKKPGYIPVGSAITSYARNFTIRTAQANYHGKDKPGFIYADTDSIHCDLKPEELVNVPVHPVDFCHWKLESYWDDAIFARQKTYIEHVTHEDGKPVKEPYYSIKCAGMPDKCKELLNISMTTREPVKDKKYTEKELEFITTPRTMADFKVGLSVPGKLLPKRIKGGILLTEVPYEMR